jgi:hypothetical protein
MHRPGAAGPKSRDTLSQQLVIPKNKMLMMSFPNRPTSGCSMISALVSAIQAQGEVCTRTHYVLVAENARS